MSGNCSAEIWNLELTDGWAVLWALQNLLKVTVAVQIVWRVEKIYIVFNGAPNTMSLFGMPFSNDGSQIALITLASNTMRQNCRKSCSENHLRTLHFATQHVSTGFRVPVVVWGDDNFWTMKSGASACKSLKRRRIAETDSSTCTAICQCWHKIVNETVGPLKEI